MNLKRIVLVLGIPAVLIGSFIFNSYLASQKELPPQRPAVETKNYVKVEKVSYQQIPVDIEALGRVVSSQPLDLVAEVNGRLIKGEIELKEGETFRSNQVIAKIDNEEPILNLKSRKSNFLKLLAQTLPNIGIDYKDDFEAWSTYAAEIDLDENLPELPEITDARLKTFLSVQDVLSEYYSIKSQEVNLAKYVLNAPYDGSIVSVNSELGSVVNNGTNIASLIRTDKLELKVPILKDDIGFVSIGQKVKVINEDGSKEWTGTITRKADFIDPNNQSINVYISLRNARKDIYDGLYLRAIIAGKYIPKGVPVDRSLIRNKDEIFIFEDSLLHSRTIDIIQQVGDRAIIQGIEEGEFLVTEAPANAFNNMKVEIME